MYRLYASFLLSKNLSVMHAEANFSCLRAATISRWLIILDEIFDDVALQHFEFHSNEQYEPANMAKWTTAQALEDLQYIYLMHTMQGDTCPTVILQICACVKQVDWLKVDIWIHDPAAADTSHNDFQPIRIQDTGCLLASDWSKIIPLCNVSAVAGPCTFSPPGNPG